MYKGATVQERGGQMSFCLEILISLFFLGYVAVEFCCLLLEACMLVNISIWTTKGG